MTETVTSVDYNPQFYRFDVNWSIDGKKHTTPVQKYIKEQQGKLTQLNMQSDTPYADNLDRTTTVENLNTVFKLLDKHEENTVLNRLARAVQQFFAFFANLFRSSESSTHVMETIDSVFMQDDFSTEKGNLLNINTREDTASVGSDVPQNMYEDE